MIFAAFAGVGRSWCGPMIIVNLDVAWGTDGGGVVGNTTRTIMRSMAMTATAAKTELTESRSGFTDACREARCVHSERTNSSFIWQPRRLFCRSFEWRLFTRLFCRQVKREADRVGALLHAVFVVECARLGRSEEQLPQPSGGRRGGTQSVWHSRRRRDARPSVLRHPPPPPAVARPPRRRQECYLAIYTSVRMLKTRSKTCHFLPLLDVRGGHRGRIPCAAC